jgi:hypothetical protein
MNNGTKVYVISNLELYGHNITQSATIAVGNVVSNDNREIAVQFETFQEDKLIIKAYPKDEVFDNVEKAIAYLKEQLNPPKLISKDN